MNLSRLQRHQTQDNWLRSADFFEMLTSLAQGRFGHQGKIVFRLAVLEELEGDVDV
jgi:hypothetical protein